MRNHDFVWNEAWNEGPRRRIALAAAACLATTNCVSVTAVQRHVTQADIDRQFCPTKAQMNLLPADPAKHGAYRDGIILECVKAINRNYADFKSQLHQESTSVNLFTDLLSQTLATFASVDSGGTAKGLAASSGLVTGGGRAINKNIFFDTALPALEASMDAVRARVLKSIVDAQNTDREAKIYTLARAGSDLDAYEAAGSLYAGLSELTEKATASATVAKEDLAQSQQGRLIPLAAPVLLERSLQARVTALMTKVRTLTSPADTAKLDQVIDLLKVPTQPTDTFETKRNNVVQTIANSAMAKDPVRRLQNITALETMLSPVLK